MWAAQVARDAADEAGSEGSESETGTESGTALPPAVDLFSLSEKELEDIDYYKVLHLPCLPSVTPDDVKKAYRKSCLKYHPDKSGRGEEDAVFLKVKAAFETLSTQKIAYDSTEMPFNDSIPSDNKIAKKDFFELFRPVFERNLHFDSRLLPGNGNADTPIEEVQEFYDYWIHFESWRDFSLQAARELETQEHLENAESRYEKRWFQKEIDRAAKKLKQHEVARIGLLVEKAMAADPRMIQEKKRLIEEKERKQREREQAARDKKQAEEDAKRAEEQKAEEEKKRKAEEKVAREQGKKKLRKAKQAFKKYAAAALEELGEKEHALEDEIDLICAELDLLRLTKLNDLLDSKPAADDEDGNGNCDGDTSPKPATNGSLTNGHSKEETKKTPPPTPTTSAPKKKTVTFTKEEMTALAKGAKKFPAGGANRWDQISNYINNVCRPQDPRTKEDCIEVYNKLHRSAKPHQNGNKSQVAPTSVSTTTASTEAKSPDNWTAEQDQLLQQGLSTYPSSMDKNERWSNISSLVKGKSKKECVARFKEIRNALKAKK
eukprot:jgi/Psemu1/181160/e_gw1.19.171.1